MSMAGRIISAGIKRGLLQGTLRYAGKDYPCRHSPVGTEQQLSPGGFTPATVVTIVIDRKHCNGVVFATPRDATLTAADTKAFELTLKSADAAGNPYFVQLTGEAKHQGA
jgi:hypothetical protein